MRTDTDPRARQGRRPVRPWAGGGAGGIGTTMNPLEGFPVEPPGGAEGGGALGTSSTTAGGASAGKVFGLSVAEASRARPMVGIRFGAGVVRADARVVVRWAFLKRTSPGPVNAPHDARAASASLRAALASARAASALARAASARAKAASA